MQFLCWLLKDYLYNFDSEILLIVDLRIAAFDDLTSVTSASTAAMHSQNPHPPSGSRWEKTDATERPQLVELCDEQWNVFVIFHSCKLTLYNWLLFKEYHELQLSLEMIGIKFEENRQWMTLHFMKMLHICLERSNHLVV